MGWSLRITGQEPEQLFLIMYESLPIVSIQTYVIDAAGADPDTMDGAGLNLFISDAASLPKGRGVSSTFGRKWFRKEG